MILKIGLLLVTIFGLIYFSWRMIKKNQQKLTEQLVVRKASLSHRPIFDELNRMKELIMLGETEKAYRKWHREWDQITRRDLPALEIPIFDVETLVDKLQFKKAAELRVDVEEKLSQIEEKIDRLSKNIHQLLTLAESNETTNETLKELFKELRKQVIIHNHAYGVSLPQIELELTNIVEDFIQVDHEEANGNIYQSREMLEEIERKYNLILEKTHLLPDLILSCRKSIPEELRQLRIAYQEMVDGGYLLTHIHFPKEIKQIENALEKCERLLEQAEAKAVQTMVGEINGKIDTLCQQLADEGEARQYITVRRMLIAEQLIELRQKISLIRKETDNALKTYYLSKETLAIRSDLEEKFNKLLETWHRTKAHVEENATAASNVKKLFVEVEKELERLFKEEQKYEQMLKSLRKDELIAKEKVSDLRVILTEIATNFNLVNMPGLPQKILILQASAKESLALVSIKLTEKPLDMKMIHHHLEEAISKCNELKRISKRTIEDMLLAEKVLVYGNRYRVTHPKLAIALNKAEEKFNCLEFKDALEMASTSIEKVEPGFFRNLNYDHELFTDSTFVAEEEEELISDTGSELDKNERSEETLKVPTNEVEQPADSEPTDEDAAEPEMFVAALKDETFMTEEEGARREETVKAADAPAEAEESVAVSIDENSSSEESNEANHLLDMPTPEVEKETEPGLSIHSEEPPVLSEKPHATENKSNEALIAEVLQAMEKLGQKPPKRPVTKKADTAGEPIELPKRGRSSDKMTRSSKKKKRTNESKPAVKTILKAKPEEADSDSRTRSRSKAKKKAGAKTEVSPASEPQQYEFFGFDVFEDETAEEKR